MIDQRDRRILALAVPALGALAAEPLYVLVDTAIVGRLGTVPLGGLAIATTLLTTLAWACNFLIWGTTTRVAFASGRGDHRAAAGVAAQSLWLCAAIGIPLAVAVAAAGRPLAAALGGEGAILDAATTYLRISAASMPALLIVLAAQGYLRGLSDTRTPLKVLLVANGLNVVLEVVLVYGFDLGVAGSAWGTLVAQLAAAGWLLWLCGRRILATSTSLRPRPVEMAALVRTGGHVFVRTAALLAVLTLATAAAARVDSATLGAHQITYQFFVFLALTTDALAVAGQAIIGTDLGASAVDQARELASRLVRLGCWVGGITGLTLVALSPVLPHAFTGDGAVASRATVALVLLGAMQIPGAVTFVLDGVLMGGSDFAYVKWATLAGLAVFAPVAGAVLLWPDLGIAGVWVGLLLWMTTRTVLNLARFRSGRWTAVAT
jgi:putative MATE family efflux protein